MHLSRQAVGPIISLPVRLLCNGDTLFPITAQARAIFLIIFDDGSAIQSPDRLAHLSVAKTRRGRPPRKATFTASAVDIIAVRCILDVFFSPLAHQIARRGPVTQYRVRRFMRNAAMGQQTPKHWRLQLWAKSIIGKQFQNRATLWRGTHSLTPRSRVCSSDNM